LWLALWLGACSSNDDTTKARYGFTDAEGRSCQATLERASADAPVLSATIECDGERRACSSESHPCFQLDIALQSFEIMNCPACCRGAASSFYGADCSPLTCEADTDCVYASARCTEGVCLCPGGSCD
jgi:hypothetical protein